MAKHKEDIFALDSVVPAGDGKKSALHLKEKISGITRLSPRVKLMMVGGGVLLALLFQWALSEVDQKTNAGQQQAAAEVAKPSESGPAAMPADLVEGVDDGRALPPSPAAGVPMVGMPLGGAGAASGVPGGGQAAGVMPGGQGGGGASTQGFAEMPVVQSRTSSGGNVNGFVSGGGMGGMGSGADMLTGMMAARDAAIQKVTAGASGGGAGGVPPGVQQALAQGASTDQNLQARKEAFVLRAMSEPADVFLGSMRQAPISNYQISAGSVIPCMLLAAVNSDLPGMLRGIVTENVYDSLTHRHLLIPQGTVVTGYYDSQIAFGQSRLLVVWNLMTFPDTSTLSINGMPAGDATGAAGIGGDVDNHWLKIFGAALATSVVTGAIQLSQPPSATTNGQTAPPTVGQTMTAALGQQLGQVGMAITQKNLAVQPTIRTQAGTRFIINVTKTMVFTGPYRP